MRTQNWKSKFVTLWCGQAVSLLTSSILQMSIVWYMTQKTGSAAVLSFATLVGFVPQAVLGTFIGVFIDRHSRKKIMILADSFIAVLGVVLAASTLFGEIPIWLIMTVLFLRSFGAAFHYPALQALTPAIVPREELTKYAGYAQSFEAISMILSPALAAALFSAWNLNAIILLDVAGAMLAVTLLGFVHIPKQSHENVPHERKHVLHETADGFRILRQVKGMTALLVIGAAYAIVYFPIGTLYPLITMTYFGGTIAQSGTVEVIFAAGSLLGSLALGWMGNKISKIGALSISVAVYGAGVLLTGLLPPGGLRTFMLLSVFMGISVPFYTGVETAIFQMQIPEKYLGRIFSLSSSVSMVAMPLSLVLSGSFAETVGVDNWFLYSGIFAVLLAAIIPLIPSLRHCCRKKEE